MESRRKDMNEKYLSETLLIVFIKERLSGTYTKKGCDLSATARKTPIKIKTKKTIQFIFLRNSFLSLVMCVRIVFHVLCAFGSSE